MSKKRTQAKKNGDAEAAEAPAQENAPMPNPFGDLNQVRQILFGAESQEIHQRFVDLEKHFNDVIATLKDSVNQRFDAVEAALDKQNDALSKRLADEGMQRAKANDDLDQNIQNVAQALRDNRAQLDTHIAETESALRGALKEEADKALKDRTARFEDLSARLEESVTTLSDAKTDRFGLADLLDHISAELRNSA